MKTLMKALAMVAVIWSAVPLLPRYAAAFSPADHKSLTAAAFRVLADPATDQSFQDVSGIGDTDAVIYGTNPWHQSAAHYDNCAWDEGQAWVRGHRDAAVMSAISYYQSGSAARLKETFDHLGFVLHATEDFYAHSNWVETHNWGVVANLDGAKPANWVSGTWAGDEPKRCPAGAEGHDYVDAAHPGLNKDKPGRPGYDEARADAILAVQEQLRLFQIALRTASPQNATAILDMLHIREQPRVISDTLMLSDARLYFFQGLNYTRYDWAHDHTYAGYPLGINCYWPGLEPFASGIDAAFQSSNGKVYFFKGANYIRYTLGSALTSEGADPGYPRSIASNWPGLWTSNLDAIALFPNGKVYAWKGAQYIRYDLGSAVTSEGADPGYPRTIAEAWHGLEPFSGGIDAVFVAPDGHTAYFFKGDYYIRYNIDNDQADGGYPLRIEDYWHGL